jgi:hypothetical protein
MGGAFSLLISSSPTFRCPPSSWLAAAFCKLLSATCRKSNIEGSSTDQTLRDHPIFPHSFSPTLLPPHRTVSGDGGIRADGRHLQHIFQSAKLLSRVRSRIMACSKVGLHACSGKACIRTNTSSGCWDFKSDAACGKLKT